MYFGPHRFLLITQFQGNQQKLKYTINFEHFFFFVFSLTLYCGGFQTIFYFFRGFFNLTLPLYGPRTYRADDYNDPIHLERISTLNMFITKVNTYIFVEHVLHLSGMCVAYAYHLSDMSVTFQACVRQFSGMCVNSQACGSSCQACVSIAMHVNHTVKHVPGRHLHQLSGM